jgi:hypothetical protein
MKEFCQGAQHLLAILAFAKVCAGSFVATGRLGAGGSVRPWEGIRDLGQGGGNISWFLPQNL